MKTLINPNNDELKQLFLRPAQEGVPEELVKEVFERVAAKGDLSIKKYTQQFDGVNVNNLRISPQEIESQAAKADAELVTALARAIKNIRIFHQTQRIKPTKVMTTPGVNCWMESRALERVGLYVPGGTAPLFSTLCMLAVPAQVAGVDEIIVCTPPDKNGELNPAIAWVLQFLEIEKVFLAGGIQAIAGMAIGTKKIPKVQKIFGPGNKYVEAAKQFATRYGAAFDLPAGPSEVLVLADDKANVDFVASDLLAQAEHDTQAQVGVIARSSEWLAKLQNALDAQLALLPRKEIATVSLSNSWAVVAPNLNRQFEWSNDYAPEHLILHLENASNTIDKVRNAGSVFIGSWTPESLGDYASGTNHTLPTYGWAKQYSGVSVFSFQKQITFQEAEPIGIENIGDTVVTLARGEGLEGHAQAVVKRLEMLEAERSRLDIYK